MTSIINKGKPLQVIYPQGCKEISEELGKDELVRRLKCLARAFQDMGQDENDQFTGLAIYLASDFFMDHQSKDVKLLAACCIADVFRIFAPEAPYRETDQLKEIFMFLIKQLRGLEDPDSPSFKRYFYLLENLAWVKSFNICIELDDNQEIFKSLFQLMFSIVNDKHSSKVKNFMLDMMQPLIAEADSVSQDLLDIILLNIVDPYKSANKQAYQLAKDLLIRTSNAIEPYIQQFFNNTLMLGTTSESELSKYLYDVIYELNSISPSVLLAVLPQLEFKLKSNQETERKNVTKLLAKMFSDPGSNLADQNKPLWTCFLGRFNDINIPVRTICVQCTQHFVLHHPELLKDIVEQLKVRQHDPEETVRIEVVNSMLALANKDLKNMPDELLGFIKERTLDKKFKIRREALLGLGKLYKTVKGQDPIDPEKVKKIDWIKDKVFHAYYQNSNDDRLLVDRIVNSCLVSYTLPDEERMKRLLVLYATLDDHALKAFNEMMKFRASMRNSVVQLLEAHERKDVNIPMNPRIAALAKNLPEPQKAHSELKKFNEMLKEDKRLRHFLKTLVSPDCTCKRAQDTVREILKKLGIGNPTEQNWLYKTVKSLLERIAPVMLDPTSTGWLVKHVLAAVKGEAEFAEDIDGFAEKGVRFLLSMSAVFPYFFRSQKVFETLLLFLDDDDETISDMTLQIFASTGHNIEKTFPTVYKDLLPVLQSTAKMGNPKQTKHAIRCINIICKNKEPVLAQIFEHVQKSLNPESANYITSIVALGHIALLCPEEFATEMKTVVSKHIVKDLLMQDRTEGPETTESWYIDHYVTEDTQAKVKAMKLLVRWLLGLKSNTNNSGTSTLRLLYTVIIHEGDLMEKGMINKPELARLRLQAGCCLLKLAEEPCYTEIITREQFQALALLINDSCYHVRLKFAHKLHKGLFSLRLPLEYMSILSLAANDPLRERRNQLKLFLNMNINKRREYLKQNPSVGAKMSQLLPDYVMPYTIHLLAHDPDLKTYDQVEALKNIKECLWFIMEPLISRSEDYNYMFLRRMLENMKQTRDVQGPDDDDMNKKLYAVCDVALGLLATKSTNITLKDSNVEPVLPAKLFTRPDKTYSNTQNYLPKEFAFDGPKKKGVQALLDSPIKPSAVTSSKSGKQTTTEILVVSNRPVINPLPMVPKKKKEPKEPKKVKDESDKHDKDDESSPSSPNSSQELASPAKHTRSGKIQSPEKEVTKAEGKKKSAKKTPSGSANSKSPAKRTKPAKSVDPAKSDDSQKSQDISQDSVESGPVKKSPAKRTKSAKSVDTAKSDDSPKSPGSSQDSVRSGPVKKTATKLTGKKGKTIAKNQTLHKYLHKSPRTPRVQLTPKKTVNGTAGAKGKLRGSDSKSSSSGSGSVKRKGVGSSEDVTPVKKVKVTKDKQKNTIAKNLNSDLSDSDKTSSSQSSGPSKKSTPIKRAASPKPGPQPKRGRPSRSALDSQGTSNESDSASPSPVNNKKNLSKKQTPTKAVQKNVRRAGPRVRALSNGMSDLDSPTSDTNASTPGKLEALNRAIETAGLGEDDDINIKRKTRQRRK